MRSALSFLGALKWPINHVHFAREKQNKIKHFDGNAFFGDFLLPWGQPFSPFWMPVCFLYNVYLKMERCQVSEFTYQIPRL